MLSRRYVLACAGIFVFMFLISCGGSSKPVDVTLSASTATIDGGNAVTFTATVANDKNASGVTWSLSGAGALSSNSTTSVTYTAPAPTGSAQTATVTATSAADSTKTATVAITVPAQLTVVNSSPTALNGAVGTSYAVQIQASGGIPPYSHFAVAAGYTLPACLTLNSSTGVITFTSNAVQAACAAGSPYDPAFTFQDSGTPKPLTGTTPDYQITIAAAPPITFGAAPLATGTYNVAYASAVSASGGSGALSYTISAGALPADLVLNAATGAITGTPSKAADVGTFNYSVTAADAFGDTATQAYQLVVSYPAMSITTPTTLPVGYVGSTYTSTTLAASGGTGAPTNYTWTVANGSTLPAGLTLTAAGVLSGTPTGPAATDTFGVTVKDTVANLSTTVTFSLQVKAGVSITTPTPLPAGYAGSSYSQTLAATGGSGTGYTFAVASGSTLPAGLTLSAAGVLSGTPTAAATSSFEITATDSVGNKGSATFSLTINAGVSVTAPSMGYAYPGTAYASPAFSATGGSNTGFTWSMAAASGSSIPAGFAINPATGVISAATPVNAGSTTLTYNVVVTATDSLGNKGSANATLTIEAAVAITTATTLPAGTVGVSYSQTLAASGGSGTGYTWQLIASNPGTTGLSFTTATGTVGGTNPTQGTASFTVTATDSQSHVSAQATFTVEINNQLKINQTTLPSGNVGAAYSQTLTASGGTGSNYTFTATNSTLSTYGLTLASNGAITGTPTQTGTATFTANVKDSGDNTATQLLSIQIDSALSLPAADSLPGGYTNVAYNGSIQGSGGSGNLTIAITAGLSPANGTLAASIAGSAVNITGTPTTATTESISVKLTDTTTGNSISQAYAFAVTTPTAPSLPASSLPDATVNQSYSQSITATGGVGPNYTWTVNGSSVPTNGSQVSVGSGISVSNTGNNVLAITGSPSSTGTVSFTAQIKDNTTNLSSGTQTYSFTVNSTGQNVSGQVYMSTCSGQQSPPTITLTINTTTPQQVQTDNNGNFTFTGVPNGSWTITPSISGASSVFSPATMNVTVNNADLTGQNFNVALGYTVTGTVNYSGSQTGRIYLTLNNNNCGGNGDQPGTSISSKGSFTIHGVPPGAYTLAAGMDVLGYGAPNVNDPSGNSSVTVSNANYTGASVTLADAAGVTLSTGPKINVVSATNGGAAIPFKPILNTNGVEMATSYTVQWSTSSSFSTITGSKTFPANGDSTDVWIVTGLTDGQVLYFRAEGTAGSSTSPWTIYGGGTPTAVTIGAPTGGNTITGTVTFTGTATGPLLVGFYSQTTGVYTEIIQNPVSPQAYTVHVPNGTDYFQFGIIDQNNDGIVDAGDISNTGDGGSSTVAISGNATMNLTLPSASSSATVQTTYYNQTYSSGSSTGYNLNFDVRMGNKLPVAVELTAGPNVIQPLDIAFCTDCGRPQFQYYVSLGGTTPAVGQSYTLHVTYSDNTSEDLTASVTGWNGTSTLVGASNLVSNMSPSVTGTTSPTFSWTDPAGASSYTYQFNLTDTNGNTIWQIPGNNSNLNGFDSSITSITWNNDPTGGGSSPSVSSLTGGATYNWQITVQDSAGNQAQNQVYFVP